MLHLHPRHGSGVRAAMVCRRLAAVMPSALLMVCCIAPIVSGQGIDARREANLKAVFLYSFGRYVQWPQMPEREFVIGVLGEGSDHFNQAIDRIAATRTIDQKPIVVRRFESIENLRQCQILFVTQSIAMDEQKAVLEKYEKQPILLVGESTKFAEAGGIINFYLHGNTVRFEINDEAAHHRNLKLDAKLLNLGRRVDSK